MRLRRYIGGVLTAALIVACSGVGAGAADSRGRPIARATSPTYEQVRSVLVVSAVALAMRPPAPGWTPICATFEEGSMDWYLFFCFIDPPPKDPRA